MNKFIYYPLGLMFILALFNQVYYYSNNINSLTFSNTQTINPQTGQLTQNGTSTEIQTSGFVLNFGIDLTMGFLALIIGVVALGIGVGIKVLDSGLSENAQKIIFNSSYIYGFWGVFSALTYTLFSQIWTFGLIMWLGLTFIYTIGFFQTI